MEMMEVVATEIMDAALHVAVAGRTLAVAERDGTHDPATGHALTGSWLWDSSLVLASHLASCIHHHHLRGATVLELGAGTGLPGIAAVACLGAARCVLTDDCIDVLREQGFEVVEVDRVTRPLLRDPEQAADFAVYRLFRRTTSPSIVSNPTPITTAGC
uniref:Uncharacterized protein n=1 Tax=Oryza barthii TaxID=65489 RepID=A0A0D3G0W1_9ORYZ